MGSSHAYRPVPHATDLREFCSDRNINIPPGFWTYWNNYFAADMESKEAIRLQDTRKFNDYKEKLLYIHGLYSQ